MPKKTGICLNIGGNCSKARNKEIQTADVTHFVCEECGKDLMEKVIKVIPWYKKPALMIPAAVLLIGGGAAGAYFVSSGETASSGINTNTPTDEVVVEQTAPDSSDPETTTGQTEEPETAQEIQANTTKESSGETATLSTPSNGTDLGYAVWTGNVDANGLPNDTGGRMYFKERHRISPNDDRERYAEAGESIVGEYKNGKLIQGKWYKKDKNVEFITLGN